MKSYQFSDILAVFIFLLLCVSINLEIMNQFVISLLWGKTGKLFAA